MSSIPTESPSNAVCFFFDLVEDALIDDRTLIFSLSKVYRAAGSENMILSDIETTLSESEWYPGTKAEAITFMADYLARCESMDVREIDPWWEYIRHVQAAAGTSLPRSHFFCSSLDDDSFFHDDSIPLPAGRVDWAATADECGAFEDDKVDMSDVIFDPMIESRVAFLKRWHRARLERLKLKNA